MEIDGNRKASLAAFTTAQDTKVLFSLQNTFLTATHMVWAPSCTASQRFWSLCPYHPHWYFIFIFMLNWGLLPLNPHEALQGTPAPCAISCTNSGCIWWSQTLMETLHLFQCYYHQLKPKTTLKTNPTPRSTTGAALLTAGHKVRMTEILQSSIAAWKLNDIQDSCSTS